MSRRVLRGIGGTALVVFLVAAFTPAVEGVASWLAPGRPAERADAIVVLGAGGVTTAGSLTDTSLRGAMQGITLFRQGWAGLLVFSGSREGTGAEAEVRAAFARQSGVPDAAIVAAPPAYTTREEAVRIQALLRPRGIRKILLVVDGPGVRRAMEVFERVGFEVVPAPWTSEWNLDEGPEARLAHLRAVTMELAARLYYRAMGYI